MPHFLCRTNPRTSGKLPCILGDTSSRVNVATAWSTLLFPQVEPLQPQAARREHPPSGNKDSGHRIDCARSHRGLDENCGSAAGLRLAPELERAVLVRRPAPRRQARPRRPWRRRPLRPSAARPPDLHAYTIIAQRDTVTLAENDSNGGKIATEIPSSTRE
jgi:hypothetical protein